MRIMAAIAMRLFGGGRAGWGAEADGAEGPSSGSRASSPVARDCIAKKFGATWRAVVVTSLNQMTIHPPVVPALNSAGPFILLLRSACACPAVS